MDVATAHEQAEVPRVIRAYGRVMTAFALLLVFTRGTSWLTDLNRHLIGGSVAMAALWMALFLPLAIAARRHGARLA